MARRAVGERVSIGAAAYVLVNVLLRGRSTKEHLDRDGGGAPPRNVHRAVGAARHLLVHVQLLELDLVRPSLTRLTSDERARVVHSDGQSRRVGLEDALDRGEDAQKRRPARRIGRPTLPHEICERHRGSIGLEAV